MKYVAYYRVSTKAQELQGYSIASQRQIICAYVESRQGILKREFQDTQSGKAKDRAGLLDALAYCKRERATLLITRLDRLSRNVLFISSLVESKVDFVVVETPFANKLTIHIMAAIAEYEREAISIRTKAALATAKRKGVKLGNPSIDSARLAAKESIKNKAARFSATCFEIVNRFHIIDRLSYSEIAARLNSIGVPTARGGQWWPTTVRNLILAQRHPEATYVSPSSLSA